MVFLLVNFGGPRDLSETESFLKELLCDRDVVRTKFPSFLHRYLFSKIAKKRAAKIQEDYRLIGGGSPIYFDTETIAKKISLKLQASVLTFHRYLPATHAESLQKIEECKDETITVIPLFPQFTYATTGSIARFFSTHLTSSTSKKLRWIRSYPDHPLFVQSFQKRISDFLTENYLAPHETLLLFSAHGVPKSFVETGDPYQEECARSFSEIKEAFPTALSLLCYQSKFGKGEWIKPYTNEVCENIHLFLQGRKQVVFIPLSFTSDHIETLFEVEYQYLPVIREKNVKAYRCPALNLEPYWIDSLCRMAQEIKEHKKTQDLYQ